jgi:hypothetical protein
MEPREQKQTASDNTAERSWKIWVECGRKLQQQYDSGLMPPPPRPLRTIQKVRVLTLGGQYRFDDWKTVKIQEREREVMTDEEKTRRGRPS